MAVRTIFDMTFEEEKALNNPIHSFKWVAENYRNTKDITGRTNLYSWEDITFANTSIISDAANYFKKYKVYNNIDPNKDLWAWEQWWDRWEYRRLHGMTVPCRIDPTGGNSDKDLGLVWIPGKMVGHLNFGPINRTKDPDDISVADYLSAQIDQTAAIKKDVELKALFEGLSDKVVAESTFEFPDFWDGHFHTWIAQLFSQKIGLDLCVFKSRRKGFSYIAGWDVFDDLDLIPKSLSLLIAYDKRYITKVGGLLSMVKTYADFINQFTDWSKGRLYDNEDLIQLGYNEIGDPIDKGFLSMIMILSAKDNPSVARGKKAQKIKYEESGTFPNLVETKDATQSTTESGNYTVGHSTYWATVSSKPYEMQGFKQIYYNPAGHNCLAFNNIYDPNKFGTPCGMFFGHYQNLEGAIDKDGNSNKELAQQLFEKSKQLKQAHSSKKSYYAWLGERATVPAEALNQSTDNIFSPYHDLIKAQITLLEQDPFFKDFGREGRFIVKDGVTIFKTNEELKLDGYTIHPRISDLPELLGAEYDMHGCIVIWFPPHKEQKVTEKGIVYEIPNKLYYIWHDPYAVDKDADDINIKDSLGVAYVYECVNRMSPSKGDRLMASWIGRPPTTDEYNQQLFALADYFNIDETLVFENDRGDVIPYAKRFKQTKRLYPEPDMIALSDQDMDGKVGRTWGISIGKNIKRKSYGALRLRDHLGTVTSTIYNDDGTITEKVFINHVYCKFLLRQLLAWNKDGNFDGVSAMIVGMFSIISMLDDTFEEREGLTGDEDDDFFDRVLSH